MSDYRTLYGVVQFDPNEREVNGKKVLSVTIRSAGVKEQSQLVSCTFWPSHKAFFDVEKGDALVVEGKYSTKPGTDKTYHNLSVTGIARLGKVDAGVQEETTDSDGAAGADEDW
jgi:hypothetical protein